MRTTRPFRRSAGLGALLLACALAVTSAALAFDEPRDFWGVPWGSALDDVKTVVAGQGRLECTATGRHCFRLGHLGSAAVTFGYEFTVARRFVIGSIAFASRDYSAVRQAFVERFGSPTSADERPETTRGGATFTIGTVRWEGSEVVIILNNFGSPIERGLATLMTREEYRRRH